MSEQTATGTGEGLAPAAEPVAEPAAQVAAEPAQAPAVARRVRRRANADPAGPRRDVRVVIKLTPAERDRLAELAAEAGLTTPAFLLRVATSQGREAAAVYERLREELAAARRLLAAVSGNVNQIARAWNAAAAGGDVEAPTERQLAATLDAVARSVAAVDRVTAGVVRPVRRRRGVAP